MPTITLYPVSLSSTNWNSVDNIKNGSMDSYAYADIPTGGGGTSGAITISDFGIPGALPEDAVLRSIKFQIAYTLDYEGTLADPYSSRLRLLFKLKGWPYYQMFMSEDSIREAPYTFETSAIEVSDPTFFEPGDSLAQITLYTPGEPVMSSKVYYLRAVVTYLQPGPLNLAGEISSSSGVSGKEKKRLWVQHIDLQEPLAGSSSVSGPGIRCVLHEVDGGTPLLGSEGYDGEIDGGTPESTEQEYEGEIDGGNPRTLLFDYSVNLSGRITGGSYVSGSASVESTDPPVPVSVSGVVSASSGMEAETDLFFCLAGASGGISGKTARVTMEVFSGGSTGALSSFSGVSAVILLSSGAAEGGSFLGARVEKGIISKGTASAGTTSSALTERSMAASGTISPSSGGEGRHELTILRRGETGSLSGGDSTATVILRGAGIISSISGKDAVPILVSRGVGRSEAESFLSGAALVTILGSGAVLPESGGEGRAEVGKHLSGSLGGESEVAARAYSVTETSIRITSSAGVKGRALVERLTKGDSFGTSGAEGNGIIKTPSVLVGRITPDGVLSIKGVLIEGAESIRFTSSGDLHAGSLVEGEEGISIEGTEIRVKVFHESAL